MGGGAMRAVSVSTCLKTDKDQIIGGFTRYTTCDATQYRDVGPLTPRHKKARPHS